DVLAELKRDPATAWIPVVVLSARAEGAQVSELLRAGAQDYIVKPCSPDLLEARVVAARRVATEHRRLTKSETEYRELVDLAAEGLFATNAAGDITFVNRAMVAMLGRDETELLGHHVFSFVADDALTDMTSEFAARRSEARGDYFTEFLTADRRRVWVHVAA